MRLPVLIGAVTLALVGAGTARADHLAPVPPSTASPVVNNVGGTGGTYRLTNEAYAAMQVRGYDPVAAPWSPAGTNSIPSVINKAQRRGRILPSLRTASQIGMVVVGAESAWRIADGLGGYIYLRLNGGDGSSAVSWQGFCAYSKTGGNGTSSIKMQGGSACSTGTLSVGTTVYSAIDAEGWIYAYQRGCGATGLSGDWWNPRTTTFTGYSCHDSAIAALLANPSIDGSEWLATGLVVWGTGYVVIRTDADQEELTEVEKITSGDYAAATHQRDTTYAVPSDLGTDTDKDEAGSALVNDDGTQTPGQKATEEAIAEDLYPGQIVNPYVFELPQPEPNETYAAYVTRLEGLGWLGTATSTVLTNELVGYGPEAVARVIVEGSPSAVYDPLNWPSAGVEITTSTDLTLRYNPSTAAPAPTTGGGTTTVTGTPTTIPGTPAIDFTPISDIDFGCKFPYGFLTCYAIGFTELFEVTEDAPVFSFNLGWTGMVNGQMEGGEAPYEVDLEVLDDYMDLWRSILSVCLWVGAVYFVATRFLGFNAGGDPGEAIEDVL